MNARERVKKTLDHQEADRVPLALGGGPYGMVDDLYLRLVNHLGLGAPVKPFRKGHSISYMDDRVLDLLGTDLRYCWPGLLPNSPITEGGDQDTFYDSYGQEWKKALPYYYAGRGLLHETDKIEDIEKLLKPLDLKDPRWTAGLAERAGDLAENGEFFIVMRMAASHGPFQTACDFRGTENFLMDMALNPEFAQALLENITDSLVSLIRLHLETAGKHFDMVELPGDDYGGNTNTILSPKMFRKFILPCLQRLVGTIKDYDPGIKVMLHSDGAISKLIPDIISLGVDVLHPLEPLAATDMAAVKTAYGDQVSFLGGIDISHAMPSTKEDVAAEARLRISQLGRGGGYILAPSNHLQADIPAENVVALFESARKFGSYPLFT